MKWSIGLLLFLTSCSLVPKGKKDNLSSPKAASVVHSWSGKASFKDLRKNKVSQVSIDLLAVKGEQMRIEASATLGYPVASLVMNSQDFAAAIYPQKKYFRGPLDEKSLVRAFNLPLPPSALYSIAFDEPIKLPGWNCQMPTSAGPNLCRNSKTSVEWDRKSNSEKLVKIISPESEVNWFFKAPTTRDYDSEFFQLEAPSGYQVQDLR